MKTIYFDLETTGLTPLTGYHGVQIIQIGAVCRHTRLREESTLNIYIRPEVKIDPNATNIHGITMQWFNTIQDDNVFHSYQEGLEEFVAFIEGQKNTCK